MTGVQWNCKKLKYLVSAPIKNGVGEAAEHEREDWVRYIRIGGSQCFTMLITTPSSELNPYFASLFINSRGGTEYFDQTRWGTAQPNISVPILQNLPLTVPPREEQDRIVTTMLSWDRQQAVLVGKVQQHIETLREYRQALITAAVTGKIDVSKEAA